jgi:hypothetical protein
MDCSDVEQGPVASTYEHGHELSSPKESGQFDCLPASSLLLKAVNYSWANWTEVRTYT